MSSTFTTDARICPCPKCGEMIYSDSSTCRFCSAPVDRQAAETAADVQKKVNDAVNLAKWIRNAAGAMWLFVGLGLFIGAVSVAATACIVLIPVALIAWQVKYGDLQTADADYNKTGRERLVAVLLWLPATIIQVLLIAATVFA
jgi:hypothetical protein